MRVEDARINMIVEIQKDTESFYKGETFMIKGIVMQKGKWFVLCNPIDADGKVDGRGINITTVEPFKTELESALDKIKEETS